VSRTRRFAAANPLLPAETRYRVNQSTEQVRNAVGSAAGANVGRAEYFD